MYLLCTYIVQYTHIALLCKIVKYNRYIAVYYGLIIAEYLYKFRSNYNVYTSIYQQNKKSQAHNNL